MPLLPNGLISRMFSVSCLADSYQKSATIWSPNFNRKSLAISEPNGMSTSFQSISQYWLGSVAADFLNVTTFTQVYFHTHKKITLHKEILKVPFKYKPPVRFSNARLSSYPIATTNPLNLITFLPRYPNFPENTLKISKA